MSFDQDQDATNAKFSEPGVVTTSTTAKIPGQEKGKANAQDMAENSDIRKELSSSSSFQEKNLRKRGIPSQQHEITTSTDEETINGSKRAKMSHNEESLIDHGDTGDDSSSPFDEPPQTEITAGTASSSQQKVQPATRNSQWTHQSNLSAFSRVEVRNNDTGAFSALSSPCSSPDTTNQLFHHQQQQQQHPENQHAQSHADQEHKNSFTVITSSRSDSVGEGSESVTSVATSIASSYSGSCAVPAAPPPTPVSGVFNVDNDYVSYNTNTAVSTTIDDNRQNNTEITQHQQQQQQYYHNVSTPGPQHGSNNKSEVSNHQPQQYSTSTTDPSSTHPQQNSNNNNNNNNNNNEDPSQETYTKTSSQDSEDLSDDFSDWKVGDRYELMRVLGRGSYGEVAQARDTFLQQNDGSYKHVAIKRIKRVFEQEVDALRLFREIHILRRLRHVCVIELLDIIPPEDDSIDKFSELYLVFEYVDTDLYKLIMSPQYLTTEHIQTFLYQMLTGLKHIHSASVIHRDMKPANILLNEDCSLKICDFGLARIVHTEDNSKGNESSSSRNTKPQVLSRQLTKHVVTRWYRAPELILIQPYTTAVDMWSLGCILAELLSMQEGSVPGYGDRNALFPGGSCFPLSGDSIQSSERLDQLSVILGVIGTPSPEDVESIGKANEYIKSLEKKPAKCLQSMYPAADHNAISLLQQMLQFNPKKRCTAEEALEHEFLKGVRNKEMEVDAEQLIGPNFLNSNKISVAELKRQIFEEVMWFKHKGKGSNTGSDTNKS